MNRTNESPFDSSVSMDGIGHRDREDKGLGLALLGGDARQIAVSAFLAEAGYTVRVMGIGGGEEGDTSLWGNHRQPQGIRLCQDLTRALEGCVAVVLPYPASKDGQTVQCPLDTRHTLTWAALCHQLKHHRGITVFGGRIPEAWVRDMRALDIRVVDYEESEAFLIKNARLTAEGAVMTAMELTDTALLNASVAVVGYGRIGQLLSRLLVALGAQVTVFARRAESLTMAEMQGCRAASTADLTQLCVGHRVIFNTVPERIMGKELLSVMPCGTLIIELASAPGGLDPEGAREAARRCGLQIVRAPSLPGRYAPWDAGQAIADCILSAGGLKPSVEAEGVGI